jgi:hypothetical protein
MRHACRITFILAIAALLAACATQPAPTALEPPGFFYGFFHGLTVPFALIGAFFTDVRIYAFPNSEWWYDFGFFLGFGTLTGGGASSI